jgi:peptidoglycan/LPS O-acetylase OafA/YrhL
MFFILSGLSMAAGYAGYVRDAGSAGKFLVRRVFRILPLLWIAIASVVIGELVLNGRPTSWSLVLLNITTLFGFVSPGSYINTGAWSIGNEMVYYALTPLVLAISDRRRAWGNLLVWTAIGLSITFGYSRLEPRASLAAQWLSYVSPGTNLFLYLAGISLYYNTRKLLVPTHAGLALLLGALAVFIFGPGRGDLISIVTGPSRLYFSIAALALVLSFYKAPMPLPGWLSRPLATLGVATYGVYLLHPIVYQVVKVSTRQVGLVAGPAITMTCTIVMTIACSVLAFRVYESRFIDLGRRLTGRVAPLVE